MDLILSEQDKEYYLELARNAIAEKLKIPFSLKYNNNYKASFHDQLFGVFVTLTKRKQLRGCIGFIKGVDTLKNSIIHMAKEAAFADARFSQLKAQEFPDIQIEISILFPMENIKFSDEIIIGKHGLYLTKGFYSGLLLPQVAVEYGWDKNTFLQHLSMKAGLDMNAYKQPDTVLYRFSAFIFSEKEFT